MAAPNPFVKDYLMTAGPTPLPPRVLAAMAEPVTYHRAPAFDALFAGILERLPAVFGTANDVMVLTGSGTAAMDSAVSNLVRPGQAMLACAAGKFGERWLELGEAYEAKVVAYDPGWGARLDAGAVERLLGENPDVDLVYATLSETSTGVVHDVRALAEAARAHDAMLVVDAISGLGATELRQDEWGIDVVVAGSQKALMTPPGLGFVSASQRALDRAAAQPAGRYYLDWNRAIAEQRKGATPFTPAVTLLRALDAALDLIAEEGLDNVLARHDLLARAARAGVHGLGLELYGDPDERSTVVTAVELPESVDGGKVPGLLRERGITANGGQNQLKGKILRIAHCGYFGAFDILTSLAGLELALHELGADVELGSGVAGAQRVFAEAGVPVASA
ncbi:MAG TPA: alanine--glyoxylate aminotransferase family protein [Solirubrobacteraceae bacterium]|nr:alanine--glyoxylate aminotransferase family protein [Solirubrobacteraceae bacterium]